MRIYTTVQGDTFDTIAYRMYQTASVTSDIINANLDYIEVGIFDAGIKIKIPDIDVSKTTAKPPWME